MLQPKTIIEQLKKCGITHVVWLPDSESKFMYDAMQAEKDLGFIPVCREGEAFAVASGLWMGGKTPVILIQNTGLFESGDVLRGTALGLELPLLTDDRVSWLYGNEGWQATLRQRGRLYRADSQHVGHSFPPHRNRRRYPQDRRGVQASSRDITSGSGAHLRRVQRVERRWGSSNRKGKDHATG